MTNAIKADTRRLELAGLSAAALAALAADPDAKASASITGTAHDGGSSSMPRRRSSIVIDCESDRDVVTILRNGEIFGLREGEAVHLVDKDVSLVADLDAPILTKHFLYVGDYWLIGTLPTAALSRS